MELVYTDGDAGQVLVASKDAVAHQVAVVAALESATTWGMFRELLPAQELLEREEFEDMFDEHDDDEPFNQELVYGVGDGDYPPSLAYDMVDLLPDDFVAGYMQQTRLHGDLPAIPLSDLPALVEALEAQGHTVTRSDVHFF